MWDFVVTSLRRRRDGWREFPGTEGFLFIYFTSSQRGACHFSRFHLILHEHTELQNPGIPSSQNLRFWLSGWKYSCTPNPSVLKCFKEEGEQDLTPSCSWERERWDKWASSRQRWRLSVLPLLEGLKSWKLPLFCTLFVHPSFVDDLLLVEISRIFGQSCCICTSTCPLLSSAQVVSGQWRGARGLAVARLSVSVVVLPCVLLSWKMGIKWLWSKVSLIFWKATASSVFRCKSVGSTCGFCIVLLSWEGRIFLQIIKKQKNFRAFDDRGGTRQPFGPENTSASKLFLTMALQQSRVLARSWFPA